MNERITKEDLELILQEIALWTDKLYTDMADDKCNTVSVLCVMQLMGMNLDDHAKAIMEGEESVIDAVNLMGDCLAFLKKLGES